MSEDKKTTIKDTIVITSDGKTVIARADDERLLEFISILL